MEEALKGGLSSAKVVLCGLGLIGSGIAIGYFLRQKLASQTSRCNHRINLSAEKIVDSFDVEDFDTKKVFCRCWHSDKFPYCDGSHNAHNKRTGDNVGPLIVNSKPKIEKLS